jgi:hypothetical protein
MNAFAASLQDRFRKASPRCGPDSGAAQRKRTRCADPDDDRFAQAATQPASAPGRQKSPSAGSVLQKKISIGASDDPLEREADRMAAQVLAPRPEPAGRAAPLAGRHAGRSPGQAADVPASVEKALSTSGTPLDNGLRKDLEPPFGHDLSRVRLHMGGIAEQSAREVNAHAYTVGQHIVFGAGQFAPGTDSGRRLLAHELAHVVQQAGGMGVDASGPLRRQLIPVEVGKGQPASVPLAGPYTGIKPFPASPPVPASVLFEQRLTAAKKGMSSKEAREALDIYKKLSPAERKKAFDTFYPSGEITILLHALTAQDAAGAYRDEVAQLLRWVEEAETRKTSGMTDELMAQTQAKFKQAEAVREAQAKLAAATPKAVVPPPPTPAQIEVARKEALAKTSITPTVVTTWDKKSDAEKASWAARGAAVVKAVVAHAAKAYPELNLAAADFVADFERVEKRGRYVLAFGAPNGKGGARAAFGFAFVEAGEANPAYVTSVAVHEIFGHPEYGRYGTEYHLALYDKAQAKVPGYVKPAAGTDERKTEVDAYAYQETEIYSLLRSFPYHTSLAPADAAKGLVSINPPAMVEARLGYIKRQWEPALAVALVRGLYQRFLQDPRLTPAALDVFRAGVRAAFPAQHKAILQ